MYCEACGNKLQDGAAFCEYCGSKVAVQPTQAQQPVQNPQPIQYQQPVQNPQPIPYQQPTEPVNPVYAQNNGTWDNGSAAQRPKASVSFKEAVVEYFTHYTDFQGRTVRSGYWWAFLFTSLTSLILGSIPHLSWLAGLFTLATIIPGLSIGVRRLHDLGRSGAYLLMVLIPFVGAIWLIVQFAKESTGDNQWGLAPAAFQNNTIA